MRWSRYASEAEEPAPSLLTGDKDKVTDEYSELLQQAKLKANAQAEEVPPETPDDVPVEGDAVAEEPAMEEIRLCHQHSLQTVISLETGFIHDTFGKLKSSTVSAGEYLVESGIKYGPVVLEHVFKGVVSALEHTMKALVLGSKAIAKYVKNKQESLERFIDRFEAVKKAVVELQSGKVKLSSDAGQYSKADILTKLISSQSSDPEAALADFDKFLGSVVPELSSGFSHSVMTLKALIGQVMSNALSAPNRHMAEQLPKSGFTKQSIDGYTPDSEAIESSVYQTVLPGNALFIVMSPKKDVESSEIVAAYKGSRMLLGLDTQRSEHVSAIDYLDADKLLHYIDQMLGVCKMTTDQMKVYDSINKERNSLKLSVVGYAKHLFDSEEQVTLGNSLAEFVSVKMAFMDQTYLSGFMAIHNYTVSLLSAGLTFSMDNAKMLSK